MHLRPEEAQVNWSRVGRRVGANEKAQQEKWPWAGVIGRAEVACAVPETWIRLPGVRVKPKRTGPLKTEPGEFVWASAARIGCKQTAVTALVDVTR